jgi:hypothetical protein
VVPDQPGQKKNLKDTPHPITTGKRWDDGLWPVVPEMAGSLKLVHDCGPGWPGQKARLNLQNIQSKKGWGVGGSCVAQGASLRLSHKHRALS